MIHKRFKIKEFHPHFPLDDLWEGEIVSAPLHICKIEQIRAQLRKKIDLGPGYPTDVFVMARGEAPERHLTKLSGVPYRPADKPWPTHEGQPLRFLGQLCFADSRDIIGDLPGDVLLIFAYPPDSAPEEVFFEWYPLGLSDLVAPKDNPHQDNMPLWGFIHRTVAYDVPDDWEALEEHIKDLFSHKIRRVYQVYRLQATQIGPKPFFIQDEPKSMRRILGSISSVSATNNVPFPWVNRARLMRRPRRSPDIHGEPGLGDMGALYVWFDNKGKIRSETQWY